MTKYRRKSQPSICILLSYQQFLGNTAKLNTALSNDLFSNFSILMSIIIGPWSDKNGRKPVLLIPILGHIVAQCVYIFNVYFWVGEIKFLQKSVKLILVRKCPVHPSFCNLLNIWRNNDSSDRGVLIHSGHNLYRDQDYKVQIGTGFDFI